jgi:hypothetical protein
VGGVNVLGILTDGRADYLCEAMDTIDRLGKFDERFIVDDSGDPDYTKWLRENFRGVKVYNNPTRRGLAGAVEAVWHRAVAFDADFLFHMEDDFLINEPIDVRSIVATLEGEPDVAQMLLKRQPLVHAELAAGDILGAMGDIDARVGWVTQQTIFSLNPCVIPRWVLELGWPSGNEAEMTRNLLAQGARFGVWGDPGSRPLVHHIGDSRSSGWML